MNMVGMVSSMRNTPQQMLSNMGDVLFDLKGKISDLIYPMYSEIIGKVADVVFALTDEDLNNIANTVGNILKSIMEPLSKMTDVLLKFVDSIKSFALENPKLAEFIGKFVAMGSVILILSGSFLKLIGTMGMGIYVLQTFRKVFSVSASSIFLGAIKISTTLLPLILLLSAFRVAWKNDFLSIRTNTTTFVKSLKESFVNASTYVNGSIEDMKSAILGLNKNNYFDNLTLSFMKVIVTVKALSDAWSDGTISSELFYKANELGILDTVSRILDLKYRLESFFKGFSNGITSAFLFMSSAFKNLGKIFDGTFLGDALSNVATFLEKITQGDFKAWEKFGELLGNIVFNFMLLFAIRSVVGKVIMPIYKSITLIVKTFSAIKGFFMWLSPFVIKFFTWGSKLISLISIKLMNLFTSIVSGVASVISGVVGAIKSAFVWLTSSVGGFMIGTAAVVVGFITAFLNFFDMLKNGFSWLKEALMVVGIAIAVIGAIILGAPALVAAVIGAIVAAVLTAIVLIKDNWDAVWFYTKTAFYNFGVDIINGFKGIVNGIIYLLNLAIKSANLIPGVNIPLIAELEYTERKSYKRFAKGGIINSPINALIGEDGQEAVIPLERNLGWLDTLAERIKDKVEIIPSTKATNASTLVSSNSPRRVTNSGESQIINFNNGAIQVNVQNASEEEATRLAKMIMEKIKRQNKINAMMNYS